MKFWFLTDTPRLAKERAAVELLAREVEWFSLQRWWLHGGRFCAEGAIRVHGAEYPVRLIYPDQFPQVPAWVEPQDPEAKWTSHQYGAGGTLCLELRPDTWDETATGADVLSSAYRLLELENPLGEESARAQAPSAHHVGAVQAYDWGSNPLLISEECEGRVREGLASDVKASNSAFLDDILPIFVHDEIDRKAGPRAPIDTVGFSELPVFISPEVEPTTKAGSPGELRAAAMLAPAAGAQLIASKFSLVIFAGGAEISAFLVCGAGTPLRLKVVVVADTAGLRSGRPTSAATKHVAVVGAGSVGSKLAESLLRSGVHRLTLVDGDVLLPANLERHSLDWRDIGFHKVKALKRRLLSIVPDAQVKDIADNLNWQRSAKTHAWQVGAIADCDVIVDATGDVPTALFLGAVAAANERPFVSIEVFEGGSGALIASCVAGRDPPYATARAAFLNWCEQQGAVAPKSAGHPYESLSAEGFPLVADDAAVAMAAAHSARTVIDIIDGNPAPREAAWLLIGFRRAWLFDGHGNTIRLSVGAPDEPAGNSTIDVETLAFAASVVQEATNEASPPP